MDNKHNSLTQYARIFVLGHYLFLEAHSFPRASLSENCSLLGTDNVRGQISEHIFASNEGYCLFSIKISENSHVSVRVIQEFDPRAWMLLNRKEFAYSAKENDSFETFPQRFVIFVHFITLLVLSTNVKWLVLKMSGPREHVIAVTIMIDI